MPLPQPELTQTPFVHVPLGMTSVSQRLPSRPGTAARGDLIRSDAQVERGDAHGPRRADPTVATRDVASIEATGERHDGHAPHTPTA